MSSPAKRKSDNLDLPADKVSEIITAKELMPRASAGSLAKVLKIDDKRKVAKVLSQHKNSPIEMKTPSKKVDSDVDIMDNEDDSCSSSGRSFDTLQDAMKHRPIIHRKKKLFFTNEGKLLDAAGGLIQWAETEIESANAQKELAQGKIVDLKAKVVKLIKEKDDLYTENVKLKAENTALVATDAENGKPVNYKDFCIVCGKPWVLSIQELSFCSTECGAEAAKRMKRATGTKK